MQWVVYGAGAVGGVLGGLMYDGGLDVALVARGEHLRAIQREGLTVLSAETTRTIAVPAVGGAAEVDWSRPSTVLLTVKSHQTAAALADIVTSAPTDAPADVPVVCVQNGVSNESAALRYFDTVLGVCVMMPVGHLEPGVVEQHCSPTPAILDIGCYPTGTSGIAAATSQAFHAAGIVSEVRPDIMAWKHRKLVKNLGNAVDACCARGDAADELAARAGSEGEAVLAAAGVPLVSDEIDRQRRGDILRRAPISGRARGGGSSWQSLARSTGGIETDHLNGEIAWLARRHGIEAPVNALLQRTARTAALAGTPPRTLDAAALLTLLDRAAH